MEYRGESVFRPYHGYPTKQNDYLRMMQDDSMNQPVPVPFYRTYPIFTGDEEQEQSERDLENMKSMYPEVAKRILAVVEDECDKLEYDGSIMFDEYPDRLMLRRICTDIYNRIKDEIELPGEVDGTSQDGTGLIRTPSIGAASNQSGLSAMHHSRGPRNIWVNDMIEVLLFQEMFRRRCRRNRCRRRIRW